MASAGASYSIHVLLVPFVSIPDAPFSQGQVIRVAFLERALYLLKETVAADVEEACFGCTLDAEGAAYANAAFAIIYAFDLDAGTLRYGARGYRFGLLECGAMTQQAALVANQQGFGSCLFGGFADSQLASVLGLRPQAMLVSCVQVFGESNCP